MIATNLQLFQAINALPIVLDPSRLSDGGGIEDTLRIITIAVANVQQHQVRTRKKKNIQHQYTAI